MASRQEKGGGDVTEPRAPARKPIPPETLAEIIKAIGELYHGEVTVTVQGGKPIHVQGKEFKTNKRIG